MKKWFLLAISLVLLAFTALLLAEFVWRWSLPYNELGRYYDSEYSVVYHEQAIPVVGILAAIGTLITVVSAWGTFRVWRRK